MTLVYLNGQWCTPEEAVISPFDRGFLFADGIYEVVPFYYGQPLAFEQHYQRMEQSLNALDISNPYPFEKWLSICQTLAETQPEGSAIVYIQVTRGAEFPRQHLPSANLEPTVFITVSDWSPPTQTPQPIQVVLLEDNRWQRCDIKSVSLLGNILLKKEAATQGAFEPVLHRAGYITEGASCNYFIVSDQIIYTPTANRSILAGITRDLIIEIAQGLGFEVKQQAISITQFMQADECFLSSSTREIQPVNQLDNQPLGLYNNNIGLVTERIATAFRAARPQKLKI